MYLQSIKSVKTQCRKFRSQVTRDREADKAGQRDVLLNLDNILTMIRVLPEREKIRWREMMGEIELRNCGAEFAAFVERRIEWTLVQVKWSRSERRNEEEKDADGRDTGRS